MSYGSETVDVAMTQNELQWLCVLPEKKVITVQKMRLTDGFTGKKKQLDGWRNLTGLFI